jgi:hypothetical protein
MQNSCHKKIYFEENWICYSKRSSDATCGPFTSQSYVIILSIIMIWYPSFLNFVYYKYEKKKVIPNLCTCFCNMNTCCIHYFISKKSFHDPPLTNHFCFVLEKTTTFDRAHHPLAFFRDVLVSTPQAPCHHLNGYFSLCS